MRRVAPLVLVAVGIGLLFASGVISVRVQRPVPDGVSASPFWQETTAKDDLPAALTIWARLAKSAKPAVVNVSTMQRASRETPADEFFRRFFGGPTTPPHGAASLGSGSIVSADGYVVTNFHVVQNAAEIVVKLATGAEHRARVVGSDAKTDIALLKIDAPGLPTLPFGDSDRLEVGDAVMAIGNPFGLEQTVTTGIVSAKERFIGAGPYDDFIQTDASINPGNSGGPLIDGHGAMIGINSAIFSQGGGWSGIGFAIPVNLAKDVLAQLRARGKVTRGYLGVAVAPVTADAAKSAGTPSNHGALVAEVVSGSPAAEAGIKPGDVITAFQHAQVDDPRVLTRRVAGTPPGTQITLDVVRDGGHKTVATTLGELREQPTRSERSR